MSDQKILYSHGKKFLIHISEKINPFLGSAVLHVASTFPDFSFGFKNNHLYCRPVYKHGVVQYYPIYIGHLDFGQSGLLVNLDINQI